MILIFLMPTYFLLGGKATESTFFDISKSNLTNILFHRGDCERSKMIKKQCRRSRFVYFMSYFEYNGPKKNSSKKLKLSIRVVFLTSNNIGQTGTSSHTFCFKIFVFFVFNI